MTFLKTVIAAALAATPLAAWATVIGVGNASFETLPPGGLASTGCGAGCSFSSGTAVPDWSIVGAATGQFQPGSSSGNFAYFNYVPDGLTVAYTNGGSLSQIVTDTAVAGRTYTLFVDFGVRNDVGNPGTISLIVNGVTTLATGVAPTPGTWATYSASYTAGFADAGGAISVLLASDNGQGDFDNVRLSDDAAAGVPEPASWALMIGGFGLVGAAARRRRGVVAA